MQTYMTMQLNRPTTFDCVTIWIIHVTLLNVIVSKASSQRWKIVGKSGSAARLLVYPKTLHRRYIYRLWGLGSVVDYKRVEPQIWGLSSFLVMQVRISPPP
jgi:hypothetical protein